MTIGWVKVSGKKTTVSNLKENFDSNFFRSKLNALMSSVSIHDTRLVVIFKFVVCYNVLWLSVESDDLLSIL